MKLVPNKRYRADIHLGFFEQVASNNQIVDKLTDAGFTSVTVWGSGRDRQAEGVWSGSETDVDLPEQISHVTCVD